MLIENITNTKECTVTDSMTAKAMGSGTLPVFATPAMVALMEATAMEGVLPHLAEGQGTVGTAIDVQHTAATPVGMTVRCQAKITHADKRRLTFAIEVHDDCGLIGTATHTRAVIDNERFLEKALAKKKDA